VSLFINRSGPDSHGKRCPVTQTNAVGERATVTNWRQKSLTQTSKENSRTWPPGGTRLRPRLRGSTARQKRRPHSPLNWPEQTSNRAIPVSSQATASPSMMQDRERRRASVSAISGNWRVRLFTRTTVEPHPWPLLSGDDPEAVMLDSMQPHGTRGRLGGLDGGGRAG
jgi:hypothetical protein